LFVVIVCVVGAARVFLGAMAVPLFSDVDEQGHFDLVHKLAGGNWPTEVHETWGRETVRLQVWYGSHEFLTPGPLYPPPLWRQPGSPTRDAAADYLTTVLRKMVNHEAHSPPLYYAAAAVWYKLGNLGGLRGPHAAYWVRFLNVLIYAATIAMSYAFCREYFSRAVALAVPALTAFFPNSVFYNINSDVLSPLMVLLSLWLLLRWSAGESPGARLSAATGASAAAAVLVKLTNIAVMAACVVAVLRKGYRAWKSGRLRDVWPSATVLLLSAAAPVSLWMMRNELVLGDPTGTDAKIRHLGWQAKQLGELLEHPLFSLSGQGEFWGYLVSSFYNGDMSWHAQWVKFDLSEMFFLVSLIALPAAVGVALLWRRPRDAPRNRFPALLASMLVASFVLVLMALSLRFDFGACVFPSREFPYMASGRLIAGALIPFLALYASAVEVIVGHRKPLFVLAIAVSVLMMVVPQAILLRLVLQSRYNWFHLL
jgi:hypothetical protein